MDISKVLNNVGDIKNYNEMASYNAYTMEESTTKLNNINMILEEYLGPNYKNLLILVGVTLFVLIILISLF